jgi:hypothetical protein
MDNVTTGRIPIVEDLERWAEGFETGWLKHLKETGEADWDLWHGPKNLIQPSGRGVDLTRSRLLLITSSGAYLRGKQEPFDAPNLYGDPSLRLFPADTPLGDIAFAHTHYNHKYVDADPQVLVPLRHLDAMVAGGRIGELAPTVVSFSGYLPDARMAVDTVAPAILEVAKAEKAHAALLVPA